MRCGRCRLWACAEPPKPTSRAESAQQPVEPPASSSSSSPSLSPSSSSSSTQSSNASNADREHRLAMARLEAEKLELLAAQAALASERAQLAADRKRLDLDKFKAKYPRDQEQPSKLDGSPQDSQQPSSASSEGQPSSTSSAADASPHNQPSQQPPATSSKPNGSENSQNITRSPPLKGPQLNELFGLSFPRISEQDIEVLRSKVCSMNIFYVTHVDRSPFDERVVLRGNLRVDAAVAIEQLEAAAKKEGIADRVRLFLLMDPKEPENDNAPRPVIVALPAEALPNQTTTPAKIIAVVAALVTIVTSLSYGVGIFGLNPTFLNQLLTETLGAQQALYTLPISLGGLAIAIAHELAHRVVAKIHSIKLGLPTFLPSMQVGTYGTITSLQSYPRRRSQLFDVAVAGPVVGAAISMVALIAGMVLTANGDAADWFPQIPGALFRGSILVGSLGKLLLPAAIREQATLAVHPLLVVGYTGLLANALNLIPIGRLDGGRIVQSLYGRTVAARVTGITFVLQGLATIFGNSSLLLYWSLICLILQREGDYPCQDEITEPSNTRFAAGLGALLLMLTVLTPFPELRNM